MRPESPDSRSFVTSLCFGEIDEELIVPYPKMKPHDKELLKNVIGSLDQLLRPHEGDFRKSVSCGLSS